MGVDGPPCASTCRIENVILAVAGLNVSGSTSALAPASNDSKTAR